MIKNGVYVLFCSLMNIIFNELRSYNEQNKIHTLHFITYYYCPV